MPERDIKQKIFAAIEKIVRNLKVNDLPTDMYTKSNYFFYNLFTENRNMDFEIVSEVNESLNELNANINDSMKDIKKPKLITIDFNFLKLKISEVNFNMFNNFKIRSKELLFIPKVNNSLKSDQNVFKLKYKANVRSMKLNLKDLNIRRYVLKFDSNIKEDITIIRLVNTKRNPVILSFLSEEEQLKFWKVAIVNMKKKPKQIELLSIFRNIVLDYIEKVKYDSSKNKLSYCFKLTNPKKNVKKFDVGIFKDIDNNKAFMVKIQRDE